MKRKLRQLSTLILAVLVLASIAAPASAANSCYWGRTPVMTWQPRTNIIKASDPFASAKPSEPSTPSTPSQPTTPETPSQPTTPTTPSQPTTPTTPSEPATPATPSVPSTSSPSASGSVSSLEQQVVTLVNQQRAAYGLGALTLSAKLSDGARLKSQDMQKNRYFDHNSPTYGSPFDMMRSLGITYGSAGENIAQGYSSAEAVVNAWMNSPGHRANILNAKFTQIGVGYVSNGGYWTQWFTN